MATQPDTATEKPASGPFRVVDRRLASPSSPLSLSGERRWDVFSDEANDFVATMNPTLPVTEKSVAERICDNLNQRHAARISVQS